MDIFRKLTRWNSYHTYVNDLRRRGLDTYVPSPNEIDAAAAEIRQKIEQSGNYPRDVRPFGTAGLWD